MASGTRWSNYLMIIDKFYTLWLCSALLSPSWKSLWLRLLSTFWHETVWRVSLRNKSYSYHPVPLHLSNNASMIIAQCGCLVKFELTHCRHLHSWFCWTVRGVKSFETLWWFYIEGVIIFFIGVVFVYRKRGIEVDKYISVNCFVKIWIWKIDY